MLIIYHKMVLTDGHPSVRLCALTVGLEQLAECSLVVALQKGVQLLQVLGLDLAQQGVHFHEGLAALDIRVILILFLRTFAVCSRLVILASRNHESGLLALHCLEILSRLEQSDVSGISSEIFQVQLYCGSFLGTELEESIGYVVLLALRLLRNVQ